MTPTKIWWGVLTSFFIFVILFKCVRLMNKDFLIELTKNLYRLTLLFPKKEPLRYKMRELADDTLADLIKLSSEVCPPAIEEKLTEVGPLSDLEVLDSFFEVIKEQNWVSIFDILAIQKEYANLREELERRKVENSLSEATLPLIPVIAPVAAISAGAAPAELKGDEDKSSSSPFAVARVNNFVLHQALHSRAKVEMRTSFSSPLDSEGMNERQEKIMVFLREQGRAQVWQVKQILPEVTKRTLRRDFDCLLKKGVIERGGERNNTFYQIKIVQV